MSPNKITKREIHGNFSLKYMCCEYLKNSVKTKSIVGTIIRRFHFCIYENIIASKNKHTFNIISNGTVEPLHQVVDLTMGKNKKIITIHDQINQYIISQKNKVLKFKKSNHTIRTISPNIHNKRLFINSGIKIAQT